MRFVVLGEALIDLLPGGASSSAESDWVARSGGSPMNTAAALGRLGRETAFVGRLGNDAFGRQLADHIAAHGVSLELAVRTDDPTTLAVVSLDEQGKASYAFHTHATTNLNWSADDFPKLDPYDWVHFGSFGAVIDPAFPLVHAYLAGLPNKKSFDLNVRPSIITDRDEYRRKIDAHLEVVGATGGVAKASDEDLEWLTADGTDPIDTAAGMVSRFGLEVFVLTLGADGAVAVGADGVVARVPGRRVDVVDTVGAGDTFMAGFLSAYVDGDLARALEVGVGASALVCTRPGAQPPTADELARFLA